MKADDFLESQLAEGYSYPHEIQILRRDLLQKMLSGTPTGYEDTDLADGLLQLLHQELEAFGTSGSNRLIDRDDFTLVVRACQRVCKRLSVSFPDIPFRDLPGFRTYWISNGMSNSWAARRTYVNDLLSPVENEIYLLQQRMWDEPLLTPITPHSATGWIALDGEIAELRARFVVARSAQDHSAVGNACVRILELLADVAFDPDRYVPDGEEVPPKSNTKRRFDLIIDSEMQGSDNHQLRKLARATVEVAQQVKHQGTPSRRDAGIAADSVIALVNVIRRITPEPV